MNSALYVEGCTDKKIQYLKQKKQNLTGKV